MNCTNCGANLENGAKFCPSCGAPVPQPEPRTSYCPHCGRPYQGTPAVCPSCGASLAVENFSQQAQNFGQNIQNGNIGQYFPQSGKVSSRSIPLYVVLSFLTCGIFLIYWMICLVNDLNAASDQQNDTNGITVYLLSLVTCGIYGIYWMFKAGDKVSYIRRKIGETDSGNYGILYLVLQLLGLGLINYCLIQSEINKIADRGL